MTNMTLPKEPLQSHAADNPSKAPGRSREVRFWDRLAHRYNNKPVPDEAVYQKKLTMTQALFEPHMQVLELGCGTGTTALAHAPFVKQVHGTDLSTQMLAIARDKADAQKVPNVTFEAGAVEDLEMPDQSQDVVLALSLLHLLQDKEAVLRQIHRLLKPGGYFVSSTACLGDKMKFFRFIGPVGAFLGLIPAVQVFTVAELKNSLANAGFDLVTEWQPDKSQSVFLIARKS